MNVLHTLCLYNICSRRQHNTPKETHLYVLGIDTEGIYRATRFCFTYKAENEAHSNNKAIQCYTTLQYYWIYITEKQHQSVLILILDEQNLSHSVGVIYFCSMHCTSFLFEIVAMHIFQILYNWHNTFRCMCVLFLWSNCFRVYYHPYRICFVSQKWILML